MVEGKEDGEMEDVQWVAAVGERGERDNKAEGGKGVRKLQVSHKC